MRPSLFSTFLCGVLLVSCSTQRSLPATVSRTFNRMDTFVTLTLVVSPGIEADSRGSRSGVSDVLAGVDSLLASWEERFSQTGAGSEVRALNRREPGIFPLSHDLIEMIARSRAWGDSTAGMFDITILPVKEVWGFGEKSGEQRVPSRRELDSVLQFVGYRQFSLNRDSGTIMFSSDSVRLDVGGIAKGVALARVGEYLDRKGFTQYLVVAGGDILCRGRRAPQRPWRIGVQHPRRSEELMAILDLDDGGSVVTSGDYERYFEQEGIRYHHLFNPRTAMSCRRNQSLTVYSPDPVEADALSTGLFCMDVPQVLAYIEARAHLECLVVDSAGTVTVSSGWQSRLTLL